MAATTSVPEGRALRGRELYRERTDEILHLDGQTWIVPGAAGTGRYLVDLGVRSCQCDDAPPAGEVCEHVVAAAIARDKSAACGGCGERFPQRGLIEIREDNHDNMMHFEGDRLCPACADRMGVCR